MRLEEVKPLLTPDALMTLGRAGKVAESHGGILVPQDIAAVIAARPAFKDAFGGRQDSRRAVEAFIDWGRYEARTYGSDLRVAIGITDLHIPLATEQFLHRAYMYASKEGRSHADNLNLLAAVLGINGGEGVEPVSFMVGPTSSALLYQEYIYSRATGMAIRGYGGSAEYELAQETIARNLEMKKAA